MRKQLQLCFAPGSSRLPTRIYILFALLLLAGLAGRCAAVQKNELPDFLLASWDGEDGLPVASIHEIVRTGVSITGGGHFE